MSDLKENEVKTLSRLCRIELDDSEFADVYSSLTRVLDYIDQLEELNVQDLSPYAHLDEQGINCLREDTIKDVLPRKIFLDNSPDQVGGMIRVPPVINQQ